jgi:hypothetical protein
MVPEMGRASRPGPTSAISQTPLLACFQCLLECSPFCMWAHNVSFSAVWIELFVSQASAFSVQVLGVFRLHRLVLRLLGVMFTSLLDLCQASWSSHEVLDELY